MSLAMNMRAKLAVAGVCLGLAVQGVTAEPAPAPEPEPIPAPVEATTPAAPVVPTSALPAMSFYGSIADTELFDLIKKSEQFSRIDKQLFGSPLQLRVMHALQPTASGKATGLLSAIFTGGTLGLIPAVTNNSLMVTYEVRVHGRELVSYSYQRTFTRAVNIWAKDETHGLGKEGLEWLRSTASEFTTAAAGDAKLTALKQEYERYFGVAPK
jgi:hypothetical protein